MLGAAPSIRADVGRESQPLAGEWLEWAVEPDDGAGMDTLRWEGPSARNAFFLSLLVPGAGHRYVNGGRWSGKATAFAGVDAALWLRLIGAIWRESDLEKSYRTFAAVHAGAQVEDKGRPFFVQLGGYDSSQEYVEFLLRARAWNRIEDASSPENGWDWDTEESRLRYRSLRQDADKMDRRQTWMTAALVANRLVAALSALRSARAHQDRGTLVEVRLLPVGPGDGLAAQMVLRW